MKKETLRVWNSGPPPHVGWWNASAGKVETIWRWWDGVQWSAEAYRCETAESARERAIRLYHGVNPILWTDYWPEGARVPRVDPANRWIAPLVPMLNTGNKYAWGFTGVHELRYREPISMPHPDPDICVPQIDAATCTTHEMPEARVEPDPTPEEDEAWSAFSTGQRTRTPVPLTPGARELAGVNTLALMKELFRRFQE